MKEMKYHCIRQHDTTDCGAACLATISKQHGLKTSISRIREVAGADKMDTSAISVVGGNESRLPMTIFLL
jgi:ATP-binding cassette subfamily B protein